MVFPRRRLFLDTGAPPATISKRETEQHKKQQEKTGKTERTQKTEEKHREKKQEKKEHGPTPSKSRSLAKPRTPSHASSTKRTVADMLAEAASANPLLLATIPDLAKKAEEKHGKKEGKRRESGSNEGETSPRTKTPSHATSTTKNIAEIAAGATAVVVGAVTGNPLLIATGARLLEEASQEKNIETSHTATRHGQTLEKQQREKRKERTKQQQQETQVRHVAHRVGEASPPAEKHVASTRSAKSAEKEVAKPEIHTGVRVRKAHAREEKITEAPAVPRHIYTSEGVPVQTFTQLRGTVPSTLLQRLTEHVFASGAIKPTPENIVKWASRETQEEVHNQLIRAAAEHNILNVRQAGEYTVVTYSYHGKQMDIYIDKQGHAYVRDALGNLVPVSGDLAKHFARDWSGYVRKVGEILQNAQSLYLKNLREIAGAAGYRVEQHGGKIYLVPKTVPDVVKKLQEILNGPSPHNFTPGPHAPPDVKLLAEQEARKYLIDQINETISALRNLQNQLRDIKEIEKIGNLISSLETIRNVVARGDIASAFEYLRLLSFLTNPENYPVVVLDQEMQNRLRQTIADVVSYANRVLSEHGFTKQALDKIQQYYAQKVRELYNLQKRREGVTVEGIVQDLLGKFQELEQELERSHVESTARLCTALANIIKQVQALAYVRTLQEAGLAVPGREPGTYIIKTPHGEITVRLSPSIINEIQNLSQTIHHVRQWIGETSEELSKEVGKVEQNPQLLKTWESYAQIVSNVAHLFGMSTPETLRRAEERLRTEVEAGKYQAEVFHERFGKIPIIGPGLETLTAFMVGMAAPVVQLIRPETPLQLRSFARALKGLNPWAGKALSVGAAAGVGLYGWVPETIEQVSTWLHHPVLSGYTRSMRMVESNIPETWATGIELGVGLLPAILTGGAYAAGRLGAALAEGGYLATAARLGELEQALLRTAEAVSWIYPETPLLEAAGRYLAPRLVPRLARLTKWIGGKVPEWVKGLATPVTSRLSRIGKRLWNILSYTHVEVPSEVKILETGPGTYRTEIRTVRVPVPHHLRFETPAVYTSIYGERAGEIYHIPVHPFTTEFRSSVPLPTGKFNIVVATGVDSRGRMYVPGIAAFEHLERVHDIVNNIVEEYARETGHRFEQVWKAVTDVVNVRQLGKVKSLDELLKMLPENERKIVQNFTRWLREKYGELADKILDIVMMYPIAKRIAGTGPHVPAILSAAARGLEAPGERIRIATTFVPGRHGYYPAEIVATPERAIVGVRHVTLQDVYRIARSELGTTGIEILPEKGIVRYHYSPETTIELRTTREPVEKLPASEGEEQRRGGKPLFPELEKPVSELTPSDINALMIRVRQTVPVTESVEERLYQIAQRIVEAAHQGRELRIRTGRDLLHHLRNIARRLTAPRIETRPVEEIPWYRWVMPMEEEKREINLVDLLRQQHGVPMIFEENGRLILELPTGQKLELVPRGRGPLGLMEYELRMGEQSFGPVLLYRRRGSWRLGWVETSPENRPMLHEVEIGVDESALPILNRQLGRAGIASSGPSIITRPVERYGHVETRPEAEGGRVTRGGVIAVLERPGETRVEARPEVRVETRLEEVRQILNKSLTELTREDVKKLARYATRFLPSGEAGRIQHVLEHVGERIVEAARGARPLRLLSTEDLLSYMEMLARRLAGRTGTVPILPARTLEKIGETERVMFGEARGRGMELVLERRTETGARPIEEVVAEKLREGIETGRIAEALREAGTIIRDWLYRNIEKILEESFRQGLNIEEALWRVIRWLEAEEILHPELRQVIDRVIDRALRLLKPSETAPASSTTVQYPETITLTTPKLATTQVPYPTAGTVTETVSTTGTRTAKERSLTRPRIPEIPWLREILARLLPKYGTVLERRLREVLIL